MLGLSVSTIRRLIDAGQLESERVGERAIRVSVASIEAYLRRQNAHKLLVTGKATATVVPAGKPESGEYEPYLEAVRMLVDRYGLEQIIAVIQYMAVKAAPRVEGGAS